MKVLLLLLFFVCHASSSSQLIDSVTVGDEYEVQIYENSTGIQRMFHRKYTTLRNIQIYQFCNGDKIKNCGVWTDEKFNKKTSNITSMTVEKKSNERALLKNIQVGDGAEYIAYPLFGSEEDIYERTLFLFVHGPPPKHAY